MTALFILIAIVTTITFLVAVLDTVKPKLLEDLADKFF